MLKTSFIVVWIVWSLAMSVMAQNESSTAPVKWQRYKLSGQEISLMFPKMPVATKGYDVCAEKAQETYVAYAREVVYTLVLNTKHSASKGVSCIPQRHFGKMILEERLSELSRMKDASAPEKRTLNGFPAIVVWANSTKYWIIDDLQNDRWFELWISNRPDAKPDETAFVNSISTAREKGIDIGSGSARTLGDDEPTVTMSTTSVDNTKPIVTEPFMIRFKPRAAYTDAARSNNITGSVQLKVTLLASGGIGSITPIKELQNGLTEQAIHAAQKIVFIPKKANGMNISVVVTFEYAFSIY